MTVYFSAEAERDLENICDYISDNNETAALKIFADLRKDCLDLGATPLAFPEKRELQEGIRMRPSGRYLIFYKYDGQDVDIIRILHGARDLLQIFHES
jgi:plasmid stabilization system protein ParE